VQGLSKVAAAFIEADKDKKDKAAARADEDAATRMIEALIAPRTPFSTEKYGTSSEDLMIAARGGDRSYDDGDEPILSGPEDQLEFYTDQANKVENAYNAGDPYGAALVRQQAAAGAYNMPDQRGFLGKLFGADKPEGMAPESRSTMRKILLGDKSKRDAAELLAGERRYKRIVAKDLAESKLEAARAKPGTDPTSYKEWNLSKSNLSYEQWLKSERSRSPSGRPAAGLQYKSEYESILNDPNGGTLAERQKNADMFLRRFVNPVLINQGNQFSFRADAAGGRPGPTVPVNLKPGEELPYKAKSAQATAVGGAVGQDNLEQYNVAKASYHNQRKNNDLINHLETSDARTGLGAEFLNNIDRAKALFGDLVAAGRVADTEELDVRMGSEVFPLIKSLGIGARGMDTPAEREFMRQVLTGRIQLNKETLLRMARMRSKEAGYQISNWNKRINSGELDNFFKYSGVPKSTLKPFPTAQEKAATGKKLRDRYGLTERPQ
jgi:hypothetical protein